MKWLKQLFCRRGGAVFWAAQDEGLDGIFFYHSKPVPTRYKSLRMWISDGGGCGYGFMISRDNCPNLPPRLANLRPEDEPVQVELRVLR